MAGETVATIKELASLRDNWDGYHSPPLDGGALALAEHLLTQLRDQAPLPTAHVGPESGGAVQIEWAVGGRELELHVLGELCVEYLRSVDGEPGESGVIQGQRVEDIVEGVRLHVRWVVGD